MEADAPCHSVDFRKTGIPAVMDKHLRVQHFPTFFGKEVSVKSFFD